MPLDTNCADIFSPAGDGGLWLVLSKNLVIDTGPRINANWINVSNDEVLIVFLNARDRQLFEKDAISALLQMDGSQYQFYFLISRLPPPDISVRLDGEVLSYACSLSVYRSICSFYQHQDSFSAYEAGYAVLSFTELALEFHCLQFPDPTGVLQSTSKHYASCEWIIPHRGNRDHLLACLNSVATTASSNDIVSLCFDEDITEQHAKVISRFPQFQYFLSLPSGNGPYVSRERLCQASSAEFMIFQDSDDISCVGRRNHILHNMMEQNFDWMGCHELRVDEICEKIVAARFPLDVTYALSGAKTGHPLLFPTSIIRRTALLKAEGFSTHRKFGSDTEFLLRAFIYCLKIGNVDEFLYIRRKRAGSLTTTPESALESPLRKNLDRSWKDAFAAIKSGQLPLAGSPLQKTHHPDYWGVKIQEIPNIQASALPT